MLSIMPNTPVHGAIPPAQAVPEVPEAHHVPVDFRLRHLEDTQGPVPLVTLVQGAEDVVAAACDVVMAVLYYFQTEIRLVFQRKNPSSQNEIPV